MAIKTWSTLYQSIDFLWHLKDINFSQWDVENADLTQLNLNEHLTQKQRQQR